MSLRLPWVSCVCMAIAFGSAVCAQTPSPNPVEAPPVAAVATASAELDAPPVAAPVTTPVNQPQPASILIDTRTRLQWLFVENLGVGSVLDDIAVGALDTFFNSPKEYGPHWSGFAERTGMVAANYGVKSLMEVGLGSIWGEDPRYFRTEGLSTKKRMAYVIKMTFVARNRAGDPMPAYSRFIALPASSFISNAWQPTSEATAADAVVRVGLGFLSRMGENAWKEFIVRRK